MKHFFFGTYFILLIAIFATTWGVEHVVDYYLKKRYKETLLVLNQELSRGAFYLLEKEFDGVAEPDYQKVVDKLQPKFGYPLGVQLIAGFKLSPEEKQIIENDGVVVRGDDGDYHFKRIGHSDYAVSMGPFLDFELKAYETTAIFTVSALLFGLFILFWAMYFWNKLSKISIAAGRFGDGDFSARVHVSRFSSLSSIARTFNSMADQIGQLISSHKQLVNAVSHELRTPISRIKFGMESLDQADEEERKNKLAGMRGDIEELEDLVSELLNYSKFERSAWQMELHTKPLLPWLREYVRSADEFYDASVEFSSHNMKETTTVPFNPHQLERAIHNLLQNGARFARSRILVVLRGEKDRAILSVQDDGPGIPVEERARILEPFVRLDTSRNRATGGYGLGLSIVKEIVKCHGGTLFVGQGEIGGAEFVIELPITR